MTGMTEQELTEDDLRNARRAIEYCYESGWTDGMPVVPPLTEFVDEFLSHTKREPDEVLCSADHLDRYCSVRDAAVNAVMAGCKAEYFPLLLAAIEAFNDVGPVMAQSTTGPAFAIIINGPARNELEINCTHNILGTGDRANATIGRALRLVIFNVFGIRPHEFDQGTQGTPGQYTLCFGENEEASPWQPLHVDLGFPRGTSTVTVQPVRSTLHVDLRTTQVPEEILLAIAHSMSYPGFTMGSESSGGKLVETEGVVHRNHGCLVILGPEHASHIASVGWSKEDARQFLFEHWGNTVRELRLGGASQAELASLSDDSFIRACYAPDSITIVVSGADNAGESTILPGYRRSGSPWRAIDA